MKTYTKDELQAVVASHAKWLRGETGGSRANLADANLADANLAGANLSYANLSYADLRSANLRSANLRSADLSCADLSYADLRSANLTRADLTRANLTGADLTGANLTRADLTRADLTGADLRDANLTDVDGNKLADLIRVPSLHRRMLAAIEAGGTLDMSSWHSCETTHCRAGWSVHLAGPAGKMLEYMVGPSAAGALIHVLNCPALEDKVPDFRCSNDEALADIKRLAELEEPL